MSQIRFLNQRGMSLIEIMVAMGLLSVISIGIMRSMNSASRVNKNMQQNLGLVQVKTRLAQLMRDEDACRLTIITNGGITTPAQIGANGTQIAAIFDRNDRVVYSPTDPQRNTVDGLRLTTITVRNFDAATSMAELRLTFNREAATTATQANQSHSYGGKDLNASVSVVLRRDPANPTTGPFVDCIADQGSMMSLACDALGGWFDINGNQRCHNIYIPYNADNPRDGQQAYGITSQGGIVIQQGALRVGDPNGTVGNDGTIVSAAGITSQMGGITANQGDITARFGNLEARGGAGSGNVTAAGNLTGESVVARNTLAVGTTAIPTMEGHARIEGALGVGTTPLVTYTINSKGSVRIIDANSNNATVLSTGQASDVLNNRTYLNLSQPVQTPDIALNECTDNQVAIILGNNRGVSCVDASVACPNTANDIRAMVGFNSDGTPRCATVLSVRTSCGSGQVLKNVTYNNSSITPVCCTPTCPDSNSYCANEVVTPTNDCPGVCNSGTKLVTSNTWAIAESGGIPSGGSITSDGAACIGSCTALGTNTGHINTVEVCKRGECGGAPGGCTAQTGTFSDLSNGSIRAAKASCTFNCSLSRIEPVVFSRNGTFRVNSNSKIDGPIRIVMIGGGGSGAADTDLGGHGGSAAVAIDTSFPSSELERCEVTIGEGGKGKSCANCSGDTGGTTIVRCYDKSGNTIFQENALGGNGGATGRDSGSGILGGDDNGGPGGSSQFFRVSGDSIIPREFDGGQGANQSTGCTHATGFPGAGGGGGSDAGSTSHSCNGGDGQVIFQYSAIGRDD